MTKFPARLLILLPALLASSCTARMAMVEGDRPRPFVTCAGIDQHVYSGLLSNGDTMTLDFRDMSRPGFKHNVDIEQPPVTYPTPLPARIPLYGADCTGSSPVTLSVTWSGTPETWTLTAKSGFAFHFDDSANGIFLGGATGDFVLVQ